MYVLDEFIRTNNEQVDSSAGRSQDIAGSELDFDECCSDAIQGDRYDVAERQLTDSQTPFPDFGWEARWKFAIAQAEKSELRISGPSSSGISCRIATGTMHVSRFEQKEKFVTVALNVGEYRVVEFEGFTLNVAREPTDSSSPA